MKDYDAPEIYRSTRLDDVEDVEMYAPGGYYPVDLQSILNNRFKIIHKLGYGGFATIWLAQDLNKNKNVALKILVANAPSSDATFLTLLQEQGANHPNIMSLQDVFTIQGPNGTHQCLVLDVVGPRMKRIANGNYELSRVMVRDAARQIAEGAAYLHSIGICHGDLTDSNILFEMKNFDTWSEAEVYKYLGTPRIATVRLQSGAAPGPYAPRKLVESIQYSNVGLDLLTGNIRITDFGESFFISNPPTEWLGTPASFFALEMLFGQLASTASDVWALGCLIFELQASRPLIIAFFGRLDEALAEVVHTLGPLPEAWRHSYFDKTRRSKLKPGQPDRWFDPCDMRHPLESLLRERIKPETTVEEIANLISLLRRALQYEPRDRASAEELAKHPWFTN